MTESVAEAMPRQANILLDRSCADSSEEGPDEGEE